MDRSIDLLPHQCHEPRYRSQPGPHFPTNVADGPADLLYKNEDTLLNIANEAKKNVKEDFDINIFIKNLSKLIAIESE